ncbi:uncharacterized protein N7529_006799 [Penicillium soppii]|uniref:uncharacterized protein n=1 Tax=Penicillium soppii TaxID=69789 RepID=UPI0025479C83|nr:uncharacterized protein N7529_006799 [Penicillium soppii]KAJ5864883.1 hypothetical protein N7529_006799 [Penicillium soppii]
MRAQQLIDEANEANPYCPLPQSPDPISVGMERNRRARQLMYEANEANPYRNLQQPHGPPSLAATGIDRQRRAQQLMDEASSADPYHNLPSPPGALCLSSLGVDYQRRAQQLMDQASEANSYSEFRLPAGAPCLTPASVDRQRRAQQLIDELDEANLYSTAYHPTYRLRRDEPRARSRSPCPMNQSKLGYQNSYGGMQIPGTTSPSQLHPLSPHNRHVILSASPGMGTSASVQNRGRGPRRKKDAASSSDELLQDASPAIYSQDPVLRELCQQLSSPDDAIDGNASGGDSDCVVCEFAAPCRLNGSPDGFHFRKVVSHVFGRNKAVTKIFPQEVWVHYCRKHYQRARYRARQWPFTQCDLLVESLRRMEEWNGVGSWDLELRRREKDRVSAEKGEPEKKPSKKDGSQKNKDTKDRTPGKNPRKHPTAITSPTPSWLQACVGEKMSFDEIRTIIERIRGWMAELRRREREEYEAAHPDEKFPEDKDEDEDDKNDLLPQAKTKRASKQKLSSIRPNSRVHFPDIEILPNFKPWVREAALRQRSATAHPLAEDSSKRYVPKQNVDTGRATVTRQETRRETCREPPRRQIRPLHNTLPFRPSLGPEINHRQPPAPTACDITAPNRTLEGTIGRAGSNRGVSASQQRRSERVYQQALDRVSPRGSVKKPKEPDEK